MKPVLKQKRFLCLTIIFLSEFLSACSSTPKKDTSPSQNPIKETDTADTSGFLAAVENEPDTVDFQCTSIFYEVALNTFNRLVEMESREDGCVEIVPSLAESWDISGDRCSYTFHLRDQVRFSNGALLTSSDVLYSFQRLLTHPDACNRDIIREIVGADRLEKGETDELEGFSILSDLDFVITLEHPFEAFLACLCMPGASIMDEDTTRAAGDRFGLDPACTIGTGSFIFTEWEAGKRLLFTANPDCWMGPPSCAGLDLRFLTDAVEVRNLFEDGELDVLDLDELGDAAEYFMHGDIYQDRLYEVLQIGITYIALNESIEPLQDVRVRKAMQLALDRQALLDAVYSGLGHVENGIFPHGLAGFDPELPTIPYDPEGAAALLEEAGYPHGFDLTVSVKSSATLWERTLMTLTASMWNEIGIRTDVQVIEEDTFMSQRKNGSLACYAATWVADYNDPDNFIYTFFGNRENTTFRSLCYPRQEIMDRAERARGISDETERIREYQQLEEIIVQEDAAWIPLFSRLRFYVVGENVQGFRVSWNGSVKPCYRDISVKEN